MEIRHIFGILIMISMAVFIKPSVSLIDTMINKDFGGFGTLVEKTAQATGAEIIPVERVATVDDIVMSLVVMDEYYPGPPLIELRWVSASNGAIQNSYKIPINYDFWEDKRDLIIKALDGAKDRLSPNYYVTWTLESNDRGMEKWVISIID